MTKPTRKSIFGMEPDQDHEARLDGEAEADIAAGRTVPHAEVAKWLDTWGTPNAPPPPKSRMRG